MVLIQQCIYINRMQEIKLQPFNQECIFCKKKYLQKKLHHQENSMQTLVVNLPSRKNTINCQKSPLQTSAPPSK
jgi:hypothetical protein